MSAASNQHRTDKLFYQRHSVSDFIPGKNDKFAGKKIILFISFLSRNNATLAYEINENDIYDKTINYFVLRVQFS